MNDTQKIKQLAAQCLSVRMRLLNRMVNTVYDSALRPYQVKASQMNILVVVAHFEETTSREICSLLQMDSSTFSRALSRLKQHHWLSSEPSGDGKILTIKITREGLQKIVEIFPAWKQAQEEVEEILGPSATESIRTAGSRQLKNNLPV